MTGPGEMVEIEWQFDALDLRPVERWLSTLPTLSSTPDPPFDHHRVGPAAAASGRLYLDTDDWRMARGRLRRCAHVGGAATTRSP